MLEELISGVFHPDAMHTEIDGLYRLIREDVAADTRKELSTEAFEMGVVRKVDRPFEPPGLPPQIQIPVRQVPGLKSFVTERVQNVRAQLAGESEGYRIQPYHPISPEQMFEMNRERSTIVPGLPDAFPGVQVWQAREQLGLTKDQQEKIHAILKATVEQHRPIQERIEKLQKEVYVLVTAGKEELAQQKARGGEKLNQQRMKILPPAFEQIVQILTESQRQMLMEGL